MPAKRNTFKCGMSKNEWWHILIFHLFLINTCSPQIRVQVVESEQEKSCEWGVIDLKIPRKTWICWHRYSDQKSLSVSADDQRIRHLKVSVWHSNKAQGPHQMGHVSLGPQSAHGPWNMSLPAGNVTIFLLSFLQAYDGLSSATTRLVSVCGRQPLSNPIFSSGNSLFLRFQSGPSRESRGFRAQFREGKYSGDLPKA